MERRESKEATLYRTIEACNGEIRIMASRYESPRWYCMVAITELESDLWESWEDLAGGDNDFFDARKKLFGDAGGDFAIALGETPEAALSAAISNAAELVHARL